MRDEHEGLESLRTFGSELSRWPAERAGGVREALLARPDFRRAWDAERALDRALADARGEIDRTIAVSGAAERVRRAVLARVPRGIPAVPRLAWRRVAAAVLVASLLGATTDLLLPGETVETDLAALDPLYALDAAEVR